MCTVDKRWCFYCGSPTAELRPYGPEGAQVCHPCATSTPERAEATKRAFGALLEANESISPLGVAAIGQESGPVPFDLPAT